MEKTGEWCCCLGTLRQIGLPELSYHADKRYGENDQFDNILIQGDNLLALKALEQDYAGKVKCIYIDPPFNTGNAFEFYDDGLEHSIWLSTFRERIEYLRILLREDGLILVHLDHEEMAYAKVLLDEIFGRRNFLNMISLTTNDPSGFKATSSRLFSTANFILIYAKDKTCCTINKLFTEKSYDEGYSKVLLNPKDEPIEWKWAGLRDFVARELGFEKAKIAQQKLGKNFNAKIAEYALNNADRVFQLVAIGGGAKKKRQSTIKLSSENRGRVFIHPNEDIDGFFIGDGRQLAFYSDRLEYVDGKLVPAQLLTDIWTDVSWNGIANEGSVQFKNGKKPEKLIKRCLELGSNQGDLILDSFGGSGTTAAVAHKMGRKWIMVELGDHAQTHIVPRLNKVIDGEDSGGVTEATGWKGGGGYRFYRLAPSLLEKDPFGNWVISKDYDANMLSAAICKVMGFTYSPSDKDYWNHGYSTESDFIFVTTNAMTHEALVKLSMEVGPDRSLMVCCKAFNSDPDFFDNLTLKKIPHAVLDKCEWGKDDYSLNVQNLPMFEDEEEDDDPDLFDLMDGDDAG